MVIVAIVGSRTFDDYKKVTHHIDKIKDDVTLIVSGGAKGADFLAEKYSKENNIPIKIIKPKWDKYGKSSGPIRNKKIVDQSDVIYAFWDGISPGTKSTVEYARSVQKPITIDY